MHFSRGDRRSRTYGSPFGLRLRSRRRLPVRLLRPAPSLRWGAGLQFRAWDLRFWILGFGAYLEFRVSGFIRLGGLVLGA